jgi:S-adenosylmethionine:tRNA ribosyltransferase-isomerase
MDGAAFFLNLKEAAEGVIKKRDIKKKSALGFLSNLLYQELMPYHESKLENSLLKQDLYYIFPPELIAAVPQYPPRVMKVTDDGPQEISFEALLRDIHAEDVLVVNNTQVLPRKVSFHDGQSLVEILFIESSDELNWTVLMPAQKLRPGDQVSLPGEVTLKLIEKGLPQKGVTSLPLTETYFQKWGSFALPPYILKQRQTLAGRKPPSRVERHDFIAHDFTSSDFNSVYKDSDWYQPIWQQYFKYQKPQEKMKTGSLASPTASLHFKPHDYELLKSRGVEIVPLTLHVGLGTFLPVKTEKLSDHLMHFEWVEIPTSTWEIIKTAKQRGNKVWAVGTTVARALESIPLDKLELANAPLAYQGMTDLFIQPGFKWKVVDRLLTNFHQPESTLLALVASIFGLEKTLQHYHWAIEKRFRLFSYGDLSVWMIK